MDDRSLKALEFCQLIEVLKAFTLSPLGRKRAETLRPSSDPVQIRHRLLEVLELKRILEAFGDIPLKGLRDIEGILKRLEVEGSVLEVRELLDVYHQIELCKELKRFFQKIDDLEIPLLQSRISQLSDLKALERRILHAISTTGEILDRASPALEEIRGELAGLREKAKTMLEHLLHRQDLQSIFQEQFITLRNGRYVLLIKSDYKHRLKGIIHDQSQSGMSYFFEPLEVVGLNNEISILLGEEKEEEYRILSDLSNGVREHRHPLWNDLELLGELDLLYAMAKLSIRLGSVGPALREDGKIDLRGARNPILILQKADAVVPIDLRIGDGIRTLIISGANAGGKTVALKTLGLLTLMIQCGLPIPVKEESQAVIFNEIFAVIGDEQSIEGNLSTFSSHLLHLNQILEKAGPRSLILLDELGVGTHASEGCALAMAFLDRFREKGSCIVVTTHFDRLKTYGYLHRDVENVAVAFDEKTLEPQYTLLYGISGMSNAFLVAEKLGISEAVLRAARQHQDGGEQEVGRVLERLERLGAEMERERGELLRMKEDLSQQRERLREALEGIKRKRRDIFSRAEEKARRLVLKVEEELRTWAEQWKEEKSHSKPSRIAVPRGELYAIREKVFPPSKGETERVQTGGIRVGDHVKILSLRTHGVVTEVDESLRQVEIHTDRARVRTSFEDVLRSPSNEGQEMKPQQILIGGEEKEVSSELNVVGLTVEDALPRVDKFIDQALLHGLERVRIIHGVGSGRLREAIGRYLHEHQAVKGFGPGEALRGGRGITVVELR